jgi:type I restriction enzyme M protein
MEEVHAEFFGYFLQQNKVRDFLAHNASGVGGSLMRVKPSTIRDFPFAYPKPPEQRRIVSEIEKQFTRVEAGVVGLQRVKANLKRYRAGVLKAACEEWPVVPGSEVYEVTSGFAFKSQDFAPAGVPVVKIANVSYGLYVDESPSFLPKNFFAEFPRFHVRPGDILLALTRPITNNQIKTCLYPQASPPALLNQRVAKLAPKKGILRGYLLAYLRSETFKAEVNARMPQTLQPNLSPRDLAEMPIPQYFTPRPLIAAMVEVVAPQPNQTICDPACGTGGFLLAAHDYIVKHGSLDRAQKKRLKSGSLFGIELVDSVARLCCMNLLLHGIGGDADTTDIPVTTKDALAGKHGEYEIVLANPPFGKKSSVTIVNDAGEQQKESLVINRDDFWASTSNKQLNFLQHIFTILKQHGRAAVVLPDNVLFEGGAGETIRRELLKQADVHTLLRLPTGIFYAQGVKANVLFFERKPAQEKAWTEKLWIYDLRTNKHFTLKENTLQRTDLDDFVKCYNPKNRHNRKESERFKGFTYEDLLKRDKVNLDIFWLKDESLEDSANLPSPHVIAEEITQDLEAALEQFSEIAEGLKPEQPKRRQNEKA